MTQYYIPPAPFEGFPAFNGVIDENWGWIPNDEANTHWVEYQAWVAEGNAAIAIPPNGIPQPPAQAQASAPPTSSP